MTPRRASVLVLALVATGCLPRGVPSPPDAGTDCGFAGGAETRFFVVSTLATAAVDPAGNVAGMNLDDHRTVSMADPMGCGFVDRQSGPPDDISGVDNQLGPILTGSLDISGALQEDIDAGRVLLLVEVSGIDSYTCDAEVTVSVYAGRLPPGVAPLAHEADGRLGGGQTFDVDRRSLGADGAPLARATGRIANGRVVAAPFELALPMRVGSNEAVAHLHHGELRFDLPAAGGIDRGVLGASMSVTEAVEVGTALFELDVTPTIHTIIAAQADLEPDATGVCQALSIGFTLTGVPAVRGATVTP